MLDNAQLNFGHQLGEAKAFLRLLDPTTNAFTFFTVDDARHPDGERRDDKSLIRTFHGSLDDHSKELATLNRKGAGVFVSVNQTDLFGREAASIKRIRAVWSDDDHGYADSFPLTQSLIVETSPKKYQHYWLVDGDWPCDGSGVQDFKGIHARLVERYGHDKGAQGITRVLRVPGFFHMKGTPHLVKVIHSSDNRYERAELVHAFPATTRPVASEARADHDRDDRFSKDREKIRSALGFIPADDRDLWLRVGLALHHHTGGSEQGLEEFDRYSAKSNKYRGFDDIKYHWHSFRSDHSNPITIQSVYHLASDYGWDGGAPASLEPIIPEPAIHTGRGGKLTADTMAGLEAYFRTVSHEPSTGQLRALREIASTLESMADGKLDPLVYVCGIDPGVGKTQTVVHFIDALKRSKSHDSVGVIVCLSRKRDIEAFIDDLKGHGFADSDYAVKVQESIANQDLNGRGNPKRTNARVLITTQQGLEARSRSSDFNDIGEYHYLGKPRQVRIWDETILPARPVLITKTELQGLQDRLIKAHPELHETVEQIIRDIDTKQNGDLLDVPELTPICAKALAEQIFDKGTKVNKKTIEALYLVEARTVAVVVEYRKNRTALHYVDTLNSEAKPLLVLDASATVRQTYTYWKKGRREDLYMMGGTRKSYSNLTALIWRIGGGKWGWKGKPNRKGKGDELLQGIIATILTKPNEKWLVVHHMLDENNFDIDVKARVEEAIPREVRDRVKFLHWGNHSATNEFVDTENVILAGTQFLNEPDYEALGRLSMGLTPGDKLKPEELQAIKHGEHAHAILQAVCRASVRKSKGGDCWPCNAYIIAAPNTGIPDMLEKGQIFPGCKTAPWSPLGVVLRGKVKKAVDYIVKWLNTNPMGKLAASLVRDHLKMKAKDFNSDIINHRDFEPALAELGIGLDRRKGKMGNTFSKKGDNR